VVPNFFYLRMIEATVFWGTFNAAKKCWYPSPELCLDTILSWSSMENSFDHMAWFLLWHAVSTVRPYIDRRVPFQIMSNQLSVPQWTPKKLKKHLKDDQWKQDAPELNFESHSKGCE
jgi:hypothetical protein